MFPLKICAKLLLYFINVNKKAIVSINRCYATNTYFFHLTINDSSTTQHTSLFFLKGDIDVYLCEAALRDASEICHYAAGINASIPLQFCDIITF